MIVSAHSDGLPFTDSSDLRAKGRTAAQIFGIKLNHLRRTVPRRVDEDGTRHYYTLEEVAKAIGVTRQYVSRLEQGAVANGMVMNKAERLAELFDVPGSYFFDNDASKVINAEIDAIRAIAAAGPEAAMALRVLGHRASTRPEDMPRLLAALRSVTEHEGPGTGSGAAGHVD
ncbi:hypothetical protein GCM10009754_28140 [Amycolatopsis minnesotensis]|uniref:HTH cro/C1-type domain-containing protein n=1 Tax=Amycolatopsis minnesotensis TaxID=337894 RepID=A0ABN2QR91_9PSEU